jgi:hypothetical protein
MFLTCRFRIQSIDVIKSVAAFEQFLDVPRVHKKFIAEWCVILGITCEGAADRCMCRRSTNARSRSF